MIICNIVYIKFGNVGNMLYFAQPILVILSAKTRRIVIFFSWFCREITKQLKEYEKQKNETEKQMKELADAEQKDKLNKFMKNEKSILSKSLDTFKKSNKEGIILTFSLK